MDTRPAAAATPLPPRPVDDSYWLVPGRLLVGAHPGSRSRAQAMNRLRCFLESGVTCFIDLTEPDETPAYETLLPFATPSGRRIEYLREPIVDHGVPASRETMARIVSMLDGALASDHLVYLHCRAGIGRSAMAAACWLAERAGDADRALAQLADAWPQAAQSRYWPRVPETEQQRRFVLDWVATQGAASSRPSTVSLQSRLRGAWFGLALGDAWGAAGRREREGQGSLAWTQHTALALCAAESLFARGTFDARDQVERFVRWQRAGHCAATGTPPGAAVTSDVAKALATFQWRRSPMAGSHDPGDVAATALPRVLAAAAFSLDDPAAAVALAAECARPTHQSPVILDACRVCAAWLVSALRAQAASSWLAGLPDTTPPCLDATRLHPDVVAVATGEPATARPHARGGVLQALPLVRHVVATASNFDDAMRGACAKGAKDAALHGALVGALYGAWHGIESLPAATLERLAGAAQVEAIAASALQRALSQGVPA